MKKPHNIWIFIGISGVLAILLAASLLPGFLPSERILPLDSAGLVHLEGNAWACPFRFWSPIWQSPRPDVCPPVLIRSFQPNRSRPLPPGQDPPLTSYPIIDGERAWPEPSSFAAVAGSEKGGYLFVDGALILSLPEAGKEGTSPSPRIEVRFPARVKAGWPVFLAAALALSAIAAIAAALGRPSSPRVRALGLSIILGALGIALLALNIYGLGSPLRSPRIFLGNDFVFDRDPELWDADRALARLSPGAGQTDEDFVRQATHAVSKAMAYTWPETLAEEYRIRVPARENWLLWTLSLLSEKYAFYEYYDPRRALARGVGMCGQQAACLTGFLREAGLDARMVSMDGHAVATVRLGPDTWWVLDPSFNAVIPMDIKQAKADPDATARFYGKHWPLRPGDEGMSILVPRCPLCIVLAAYTREKANVDSRGRDGYFGSFHRWLEKAAYALKWLLPLAIVFLAVFPALRRMRRPAGAKGGKRA